MLASFLLLPELVGQFVMTISDYTPLSLSVDAVVFVALSCFNFLGLSILDFLKSLRGQPVLENAFVEEIAFTGFTMTIDICLFLCLFHLLFLGVVIGILILTLQLMPSINCSK